MRVSRCLVTLGQHALTSPYKSISNVANNLKSRLICVCQIERTTRILLIISTHTRWPALNMIFDASQNEFHYRHKLLPSPHTQKKYPQLAKGWICATPETATLHQVSLTSAAGRRFKTPTMYRDMQGGSSRCRCVFVCRTAGPIERWMTRRLAICSHHRCRRRVCSEEDWYQ